jgi:hypothetical protein
MWKPVIAAEQLVGRLETSSFDFKREYEWRAPGTPSEMAKDVAAFASGFGGTILVGAEHKDGKVTGLPGVADPQALIEALRKAVGAYCVPWPSYSEEATRTGAASLGRALSTWSITRPASDATTPAAPSAVRLPRAFLSVAFQRAPMPCRLPAAKCPPGVRPCGGLLSASLACRSLARTSDGRAFP